MKKLLMIGLIVPMAVLIAFASVSLAADEPQDDNPELNQELNDSLNDRAAARAGVSLTELNDDGKKDSLGDDGGDAISERGSRSIADKRGRQARRGQTAVVVPGSQGGADEDDKSGKSADEDADEDEDEDEDGDITPTAP